jgi:CHAT domain-containing protein
MTRQPSQRGQRIGRFLLGLLLCGTAALAAAGKPPGGKNPDPNDLVKILPARTALIDLVRSKRLEKAPGAPDKAPPFYTGLVVAAGVQPRRVELGPAKPIEEALASWRQDIADKKVSPAAQVLRRLVWAPLAQRLPPGTDTVLLSPDGVLHQLPWAALPGSKEGTVLVEEYALAVVPGFPFLAERLTAKAGKGAGAGLVLAVGAASYNGEEKPAADPMAKPASVRAAEKGGMGLVWKNLPGMLAELDRVAACAGKRPVSSLRGTDASTARVLAELPRARYAHLAAHGYLAPGPGRVALPGKEKRVIRNPLALSGLALAGANRPAKDDNGLLTAEGVASLSLENLELVVLSGSDTALGEVAAGEGVFGLPRAFHLAGAHNVVASLWQVEDAATGALMALFYHKLWNENKPPVVALREAQLTVYHHPERVADLAGAKGPAFDKAVKLPLAPKPGNKAPAKLWAGFVLSGPGR